MARNAEKAMSTLSRWVKLKKIESKFRLEKPNNPSECTSVNACERFRQELIKDIARKVSQIQNAGMGEFRLRDLNDEINRLLKEKRRWEDRIKELGGYDYSLGAPKIFDQDGRELKHDNGYKYFGAAKELPGVKMLFEQEAPPPLKKSKAELYRNIDADYYGFRDDEDGLLILEEARAEISEKQNLIDNWKESEFYEEEDDNQHIINDDVMEESTEKTTELNKEVNPIEKQLFSQLNSIPTQQEIESVIVAKKKSELLEKYASEMLKSQSLEALTLLGL